jgi:hypothetical protein
MFVSHGQLAEALGANPFSVVLWPVLVALAVSAFFPSRWMERFDARVAAWEPWPSRVVRVLLVAFFGFGFVRLGYFALSREWFP